MANIVYRSATTPSVNGSTQNKGLPLLNTEIDGNFRGLQDELDTKAPLASPALTGTPTAPTAAAGTNTTQLATTAHVFAERTNTATLTNKTLTNPTINAASGSIVLPAAASPAQTAEGSIVWDSDDDLLTVGTGSARKTIVDTDSTQSLTNKTVNNVTITAPASGSTLTIASGKTFTLNNTLTFNGTDASSVAFGAGGTVAYQGGTLAQFAATTSAQLAGVISDETGSGALVFATSPVLETPVINTSMRVPTIFGSNANSANLTLSSTSGATKGAVLLGAAGDTVKLNTTTNGIVTTGNSDGTLVVDTTVYYRAGGTDVPVADGGTGLSTVPANGQILIGNGTAYSLGTLTAGTGIGVANAAGSITVSNTGVTSLAGTANRVSVSAATGAVTLSGPQDIHTGATPTFVQVNLSSAPTASGHAATKEYVDNLAQGLDVKQSVRVATTASITLLGTQTIDEVAVVAGDRVLVKNQTAPAQNGIYVVAAAAWTRAIDMDAWAEVPGSFVFVEDGTVNSDTGWVATANQGGTLGTTAITWAQFSGAGTYTAGGGIGLSGTTFSVAAGTGLSQDADGISHADTSNQGSVDNSGNTFIQDITLDGFGHITAIGSGTVSIGDGAFTVNTGSGLAGGAQLGTANQATNTSITISHADTSSVADLSAATNTFIAAETYDTFGHVLTRTTGTVDFTVAANHAFQNVAIGADSGYTWGAANTNTTQVAESSSDTLTLVKGVGVNLYTSTVAGTDAIRIEHADTSTQASVDNSGNTFIQDITLDEFGHITAIASATATQSNDFGTVTVSDTDTGYTWAATGSAVSDTVGDTLTIVSGGAINVDVDAASDAIRISHVDTSSVANLASDNSGNTFIQDISFTFDTYGHVTAASVVTGTASQSNDFATVTVADADSGHTWAETGSATAETTGDTLTVVSGGAINVDVSPTTDAIRISHADTSTQASVDNSGGTFIQDITLDTYGHITAIGSGTVGDGAFTVNTGSGLTGGAQLGTANQAGNTSITLSHADTSSVADLSVATNTFISGETYDTFGHVLTRTTGTVDFTVAANHAFQTVAIGADSGYTWGNDNTNTNQTAESSTDTLTLVTGSGIVLNANTVAGTDAIRISHADTSSVADLASDNSGNTFIQDISFTFDTFGHVTAASVVTGTASQSNDFGTVTVSDTDSGYTWAETGSAVSDTTGDTLTIVSGGAINVDVSAASDAIRISHSDTSSQASVDNSGLTYIQDITLDTYGHITAIGSATIAKATATALGVVELGSDTVQTVAANAVTATAGRTYAVQFNSADQLVVNVPWVDTDTDTNTTYTLDGSGSTNSANIELVAGGSGSGTDSINVQGAGATTVAWDETNQRITITSTDTQPANGTLSMGVSGNGLSGSQTFSANQSGNATFTVTSNATSDNTASTIVFRDASGNFTAGTITATDFNSTSDARLKKNVEALNGIDLLSKVNPVQFNWKDSEKKSYGVIAQELEKILPELVGEREDGMKSVHYIPLIAMLIDAVKTLDARVKELENK